MKNKQMKLDVFATSFNVLAAAAPSNFQHEIIELPTNDTLKGMYLNTPLIEFYQRYVTADDIPILRKLALKCVSLFGSTYFGEEFFLNCILQRVGFAPEYCMKSLDSNYELQHLWLQRISHASPKKRTFSHLIETKNKNHLCILSVFK